ncbi:MAG: hypothetical protein J1F06_06740 [Prevotellaceae bacterium]|nr:hypothetical protein [Prevotellaceae bacterium]
MMRKTLLALALFGNVLATQAGDGIFLILRQQDGTETSLSAAQRLKLTFADGQLVADNGGERVEFALAGLETMRFAEVPAGIGHVAADAQRAVYYDLSGRRVECPESGLYIVKEGDVARKVLKR